jgi:exodeoxyribonuclease III
VETRRGLPGDPDDTNSRYIEAAIGGMLVGCLYLPNGNPAPGPKFDYKLRWFDRLTGYAKTLLDSGAPAALAGDFNVMPTDLDVYAPERWVDDALFRPEVRDPTAALSRKAGPTRCGRSTRMRRTTRSGSISGTPLPAMPVCASIICC